MGWLGSKHRLLALLVACLVCALLGVVVLQRSAEIDAEARALDRAKTAGGPKAALPGDVRVARADDLQPVVQARTAGVQTCLPQIATASKLAISGTYAAVSTWNVQAPNERLYNAVSGQALDNKASPRAVTVVVASPTQGARCDATTVEVHPSQLACPAIEAALAQNTQQARVDMAGIPLLQTDPSLRYMLLPSPTSGCVVVGIRTAYGK